MGLGKLMQHFFSNHDAEDFPLGSLATTPTGRRVVVVKHLSGASKRDCFTRIICRYEGGGAKDLVTLQPHQLKPIPPAPPSIVSNTRQLDFAF